MLLQTACSVGLFCGPIVLHTGRNARVLEMKDKAHASFSRERGGRESFMIKGSCSKTQEYVASVFHRFSTIIQRNVPFTTIENW